MKPETRRLFIAVEIPDEVRSTLARIQEDLDEAYFRPLKNENLHLTLAFLGDVPPASHAGVRSAMMEVAAANRRFQVRVAGMGVFPNERVPRVVWAGFQEADSTNTGDLEALADELRDALDDRSVAYDEKPFAAHVSLAYVRKDLASRDRRLAAESLEDFIDGYQDFASEVFELGSIVLIESTPKPGGSHFERLFACPLAAAAADDTTPP